MGNTNSDEMIELSAREFGGLALESSDEHYGSIHNLLKPDRGNDMGDGWETRRRREPGYDWVILKLGRTGVIKKIEIDTAYFKGNFPHQVSVNAAHLPKDCNKNMAPRSLYWEELLAPQYLQMDKQHFFQDEIKDIGPLSHIRVNIHPDGGLSRVRFFGQMLQP
jgi:allantoicase